MPGARLASALASSPPSPSGAPSALLADFDNAVLRLAWTGVAGLCVIRGREIIFRSYDAAREGLEAALTSPQEGELLERDVSTAFVDLDDGDLILAGSQVVFSNLSERQILAFVRPVDSSYDATLALANATCIGTWTVDDPVFQSYMIAHLVDTFATSTTARQIVAYPFPVGVDGGPFVDGDIVVVAASCGL